MLDIVTHCVQNYYNCLKVTQKSSTPIDDKLNREMITYCLENANIFDEKCERTFVDKHLIWKHVPACRSKNIALAKIKESERKATVSTECFGFVTDLFGKYLKQEIIVIEDNEGDELNIKKSDNISNKGNDNVLNNVNKCKIHKDHKKGLINTGMLNLK